MEVLYVFVEIYQPVITLVYLRRELHFYYESVGDAGLLQLLS